MSLFIAERRVKRADGSYLIYYELRRNFWKDGSVRQEYLAYLGKKKRIQRSQAMKICAEKNLALHELERVKDLSIVDKPMKKGTG
jgi:hypothetical protein